MTEGSQGGNGYEAQPPRQFPVAFSTDKIVLICSDSGVYINGRVLATAISGAQSVRGRVIDKESFKVAVDASNDAWPTDISYLAIGI